jgi:sulfur relay (sulfurtransferase) DsrC/TusE family protein
MPNRHITILATVLGRSPSVCLAHQRSRKKHRNSCNTNLSHSTKPYLNPLNVLTSMGTRLNISENLEKTVTNSRDFEEKKFLNYKTLDPVKWIRKYYEKFKLVPNIDIEYEEFKEIYEISTKHTRIQHCQA